MQDPEQDSGLGHFPKIPWGLGEAFWLSSEYGKNFGPNTLLHVACTV